MTPAAHSPLFQSVFGAYVSRLLSQRFHALWVRGNIPDGAPLLLAMQHVAWWDPLVIFHLSRTWFPPGGVYYAMMNEKNLRKYPFFRWIGAFGVELENAEGRNASVQYACEQLAQSHARVLLYPQGRQRPVDFRPLGCKTGVERISSTTNAAIVPIAVRYEFCEEEFPDAFVSIGEPYRVTGGDESAQTEAVLTALADRLREDVYAARLQDFVRHVRGSGSRDPRPAMS